jgi:hypothetical protein
MTIIEKIMNYKTTACQIQSHYLRTGGPSELATNCNDHHGDQVDRRRRICSQNFYNEVRQYYQAPDATMSHLALILVVMNRQSEEDRQQSIKFYFNYTNKQCSNWEHFYTRQNAQQQHDTDICQFSHTQNELNFHILTLESKLIRPLTTEITSQNGTSSSNDSQRAI